MDSISLETPGFVITIRRSGRVTATITPEEDGMEYRPEDITDTVLGKLLAAHYAHVWTPPGLSEDGQ